MHNALAAFDRCASLLQQAKEDPFDRNKWETAVAGFRKLWAPQTETAAGASPPPAKTVGKMSLRTAAFRELTTAREKMARMFTLTATEWAEWFEDYNEHLKLLLAGGGGGVGGGSGGSESSTPPALAFCRANIGHEEAVMRWVESFAACAGDKKAIGQVVEEAMVFEGVNFPKAAALVQCAVDALLGAAEQNQPHQQQQEEEEEEEGSNQSEEGSAPSVSSLFLRLVTTPHFGIDVTVDECNDAELEDAEMAAVKAMVDRAVAETAQRQRQFEDFILEKKEGAASSGDLWLKYTTAMRNSPTSKAVEILHVMCRSLHRQDGTGSGSFSSSQFLFALSLMKKMHSEELAEEEKWRKASHSAPTISKKRQEELQCERKVRRALLMPKRARFSGYVDCLLRMMLVAWREGQLAEGRRAEEKKGKRVEVLSTLLWTAAMFAATKPFEGTDDDGSSKQNEDADDDGCWERFNTFIDTTAMLHIECEPLLLLEGEPGRERAQIVSLSFEAAKARFSAAVEAGRGGGPALAVLDEELGDLRATAAAESLLPLAARIANFQLLALTAAGAAPATTLSSCSNGGQSTAKAAVEFLAEIAELEDGSEHHGDGDTVIGSAHALWLDAVALFGGGGPRGVLTSFGVAAKHVKEGRKRPRGDDGANEDVS